MRVEVGRLLATSKRGVLTGFGNYLDEVIIILAAVLCIIVPLLRCASTHRETW